MALAGRLWDRIRNPIGLLVAVYIFVGIFLVSPRITADGIAYYAETRSVILDGDIDLADEYAFDADLYSPRSAEGRRAFLPRDTDGRFEHYANVGIVVLFAPFLLLGHLVSYAADLVGIPMSMDGYDVAYVLAISLGTAALVTIGGAVIAAFARRTFGLWPAVLGVAAIFLGSSLVRWSAVRPAHSHGPAVLLECLFVVLFLARARDPRDRLAWLVLGGIGGLMISVRPITGIYAVVPAAMLGLAFAQGVAQVRPWAPRDGSTARRLVSAVSPPIVAGLLFLAGAFVGRLPQYIFARDFSLTGSSYYADSGYLNNLANDPISGIGALLFDPAQGAMWWVPVVPLGILGLAAWWRRDRLVAVSGLTWVALMWGFVGMLGDPERFGGTLLTSRHLVEASPVYMLGAAGVVSLIAGAVRWIGGGGLQRTSRVVSYGTVVLAAAWGMLQFVAVDVVPSEAQATPLSRFLAVAANPRIVGRQLLTAGEPTPGRVYIGGRLAAMFTHPTFAIVRELLLAVALLAVIVIVTAVAASVASRWTQSPARAGPQLAASTQAEGDSSPPPSPSVRGRAPTLIGVVAWLAVAIVMVGVAGPAFVREPAAAGDQTRSLVTWVAGDPVPAAGLVRELRIGRTITGNALSSPSRGEAGVPAGDGSLLAGAVLAPIGERRTATIVPPADWETLTAALIRLGPIPAGAGDLQLSVARSGTREAVTTTRVSASDLIEGELEVALPLRIDEPSRADGLLIELHGSGQGSQAQLPQVGVSSDGSLAVRLVGHEARRTPAVSLAGASLFDDQWRSVPLADPSAITVRTDGRAWIRVGPLTPEQMLREAEAGTGWHLPGPTIADETWSDSIVRTAGSGGPLVFRIHAPWPMTSLSVNAMVSAYGLTPATTLVAPSLEMSTDGQAWSHVPLTEPTDQVGGQHIFQATVTPQVGTTSLWVRIDASSPDDTIGINGAWFDAALAGPPALVQPALDASAVIVDQRSRSAAVEVDLAAPASSQETIVRTIHGGVVATLGLPGPILTGLLAGLVVAAAIVLRRRGASRTTLSGLGTVALICLIAATLGLPRTIVLGRTQALHDGAASGAVVLGKVIRADIALAEYTTTVISVEPGSRLHSVRTQGTGSAPTVEVRNIRGDGLVGPWIPAAGGLDSTFDGVQLRLVFTNPGDEVTRIEFVADPPFGR